jgi:hypothetical protein
LIEDEFGRLDDLLPLSGRQTQALLSLKQHALEKILIPKLRSVHLEPKSRIGVLRLIQMTLDLEHEESSRKGTQKTWTDSLLLCSLAKAIQESIRVALTSSQVLEELVSLSFSCARSLINLPATFGWLIDWVYSVTKCNENFDAISPKNMQAQYLWLFCCWLKDFGDAVFDSSGAAAIHAFRMQLRKQDQTKSNNGVESASWPRLGKPDEQCSTSLKLLELEKQVFSIPRMDYNIKITNVYARHKKSLVSSTGPLEQWYPSVTVRYTASQFSSKVQHATPVSYK